MRPESGRRPSRRERAGHPPAFALEDVRCVLASLRAADSTGRSLATGDVVERSGRSPEVVRGVLRALVEMEPAWVDGDIIPERGLVWWLTAEGAAAAA